jgi:hypothetical protein
MSNIKVGLHPNISLCVSLQCNYVQPRERRTLHRWNFSTPSLIQGSLLHFSAGQKRAHQRFRNDVRQKNLSRDKHVYERRHPRLYVLRNEHTLVWETGTTFTKACATSPFSGPTEALPTPRDHNLEWVLCTLHGRRCTYKWNFSAFA